MIKCATCGEPTVVKVAENEEGLDFYSCCNENCKVYAELLVNVQGELQSVPGMMNAYREIVKEIANEKNKLPRS